MATWSVALATEPVALTVNEPALAGLRAVPVTTGLPLAKGVLKSAEGLRLVDAAGKSLPLQASVMSKWWADGSIRALALDFQADADAPGKAKLSLLLDGSDQPPQPSASVTAQGTAEGVKLATGTLELEISRTAPGALKQIKAGGRTTVHGGRLWLKTGDTKTYSESADGRLVELEETGAMRSAAKASGILKADGDGRQFAYTIRYHVYAGQKFLRIVPSFRYLATPYDHRKPHPEWLKEERATDKDIVGCNWEGTLY